MAARGKFGGAFGEGESDPVVGDGQGDSVGREDEAERCFIGFCVADYII